MKVDWKNRALSLFVVSALIFTVFTVFTDNAGAVVVTLDNVQPEYVKGDIITIIAEIQIENNERIPISNILLELRGATEYNVTFSVSGMPIVMPPWMTVNLLSEYNPNFGYGYDYYYYDYGYRYGYDYNYGYGEGFDFGYGYGYRGILKYEISIDSAFLNESAHTLQLQVDTGNVIHLRYSSPFYPFNVNVVGGSHAPIRINSNADFDEAHGVVNWATGNGTAGNPWIIEYWDINGTGMSYCLYIGNTTDHFIVQNCDLHHTAGGPYSWPFFVDYGLHLYSVTNGHIVNNTLTSCDAAGMYTLYSENNIIERNYASNNGNGYFFRISNYSIVRDNIAENDGGHGFQYSGTHNSTIINNTAINEFNYCHFFSYGSENNFFANNTAISGRTGIMIWRSSHNLFVDNMFIDNYYRDIGLQESESNAFHNNTMNNIGFTIGTDQLNHWNTHTIDTTNTVRGLPVYYFANQTAGSIPASWGQLILANCTEYVIENRNIADYQILFGFSDRNRISNITASMNMNLAVSVDIRYSQFNIIQGSSFTERYGLRLTNSDNNLVQNNSGDTQVAVITLDRAHHNEVYNNTCISDGADAIRIAYSEYNNITYNNIPDGWRGFSISYSDHNLILGNDIRSVNYGMSISSSDYNEFVENNMQSINYGMTLTSSNYNNIYHNNFNSNMNREADDNGINYWDDGYPSGGNYWYEYSGIDISHGPGQNLPGSDGIGDTAYTNIESGSNEDRYPLMAPLSSLSEVNIPLLEGWNLVSLPVRLLNNSIDSVLSSIAGSWDCLQVYDATSQSWLSNNTHRPASLNDFSELYHIRSFWINVTLPGQMLTVSGYDFNSPISVTLKAGWNLVGYPSLVPMQISTALAGTGYDIPVEGFDAVDPYRLTSLADSYMMQPGEGYWVHVPADTIWTIDW